MPFHFCKEVGLVTLQLNFSDETFERFQRLAQVTGISLETVLNMMPLLASNLLPECDTRALDTLTDETILGLTRLRMEETQSRRLAELYTRDNTGRLSAEERAEYHVLMTLYEEGEQRKSEAIEEAKQRKIWPEKQA